ncbi:beta-lactamase [Myxococcus stipitatus DSM 14675]|uniref:Beta-lactamase n=1 Tax=Myxococcus stipitatus (strain DSM 14675 / JCM 12634 / Mx s8) TaxID=1278073 RepID=L7UMF9_MYXSD|nr:MBL fold metallo-hydrolase [Myxococcus stipitatus]AGC48742.1 beta-lactamase [Myxococcus stipitatus DSM 14675]
MRNLVSVLVLFPALALAQPKDVEKAEVTSSPVAGNVHFVVGKGGNIGVSVGPDGLLIIDNQYAPLAPKIHKALDKLSKKKIEYVVNTHWHGDHVGGNAIFGREGRIVAHREVRNRMAAGRSGGMGDPVPPAKPEALPVLTYDSGMSVYFNGEEIRLLHLPAGHTDGDTVVYFTGSNVVHMGDLFFVDMFPFIDIYNSGGTVEGFVRNVEKVLETLPPGARIIPGHGVLSDRAGLERFVAMLRESVALVRAKIAAGKTIEQVTAEGVPESLKSFGSGAIKEDFWLQTLYRGLSPKAEPKTAADGK